MRAWTFSAMALLLGCGAPAGEDAAVEAADTAARAVAIPLPSGAPGIGFDDLRFTRTLLVPAGRSGNLDLFDPSSRRVSAASGFSKSSTFNGGHDFGATSADEARGVLFVTDRTSARLSVVDPARLTVVASVRLAASPDYVRFVARTSEVWVTEPDAEQIEIFTFDVTGPRVTHAGVISLPNGPESLIVDDTRGRAYTNLWTNVTIAVDTGARNVVGRWTNDCSPGSHTSGRGSRGIALDAERGFVFVGCCEGQLAVLDAENGGRRVWRTSMPGSPVDIIDFDPTLRHVYVPAGGRLAFVGVSGAGHLTTLGSVGVPRDAHCVASDRAANAYVCDPRGGQLLEIRDTFPASH